MKISKILNDKILISFLLIFLRKINDKIKPTKNEQTPIKKISKTFV